MNALYKETLQWVGDGSDGSTLTQTGDDDVVVIASKTSGTPFNARLDSEKAANDYYLEVKITQLKGNFSIGCVSTEEFKAGWKCRGMFYNGNLTNASAALATSWGPRFEVGDSLGIRVSRIDTTTLEIAFYKNGEFLGTGFRLAGNATTYYPCLHISGSCTLSVVVPEHLPSTELKVDTPTGFFGDWKIDTALEGSDESSQPLEIPSRKRLKLSLFKDNKKGGDEIINISCKIGNQMNGQAEIIEGSTTTDKSITVKTGPYMMTRMMPPPEYRALENLMSTKDINKMELNEDDTQLTLSGPEMKVQCSRFVRTPEALTKYD